MSKSCFLRWKYWFYGQNWSEICFFFRVKKWLKRRFHRSPVDVSLNFQPRQRCTQRNNNKSINCRPISASERWIASGRSSSVARNVTHCYQSTSFLRLCLVGSHLVSIDYQRVSNIINYYETYHWDSTHRLLSSIDKLILLFLA